MKTLILRAGESGLTERALKILRAGGLVAFPTDTVYGLGALASEAGAVLSIYKAKDRPGEKAIPILIGDGADLEKVALQVPEMARRIAARFWPGPVTLILHKRPTLPEAVSTDSTVAVRIPDHPVALALLQASGPMAVTSANLSGQPSPTTASEVFAQLEGRIDLIIDGGVTPGGVPSTLVDCTGSEPTILRPGPVSLEQVLAVLRD
jgi:L-threonylcarbamoyladenylate synthase